MMMLYRIGIVIGTTAVYIIGTLFISAFLLFFVNLNISEDEFWDTLPWIMWIWGGVAFVGICVCFLDKLNMWG